MTISSRAANCFRYVVASSFQARVLPLIRHGADDVGRRLGIVRAFRDAHDDRDRLGLCADRRQCLPKRAFLAGLTDRGDHVRDEHRRIERERVRVGVFRGAYHADDRGRNRANRPRSLIDLDERYAVVVAVLRHIVDSELIDRKRETIRRSR
jgi:hypothetical protein